MEDLHAPVAAAGDDDQLLRRAALLIDLAKAKGAASVEVLSARIVFHEQPRRQPVAVAPAQLQMVLLASRLLQATR